ncbi:MAG TPA: threonine-phosphate decarboxylase CobD [Geopsychrobacteraceae bacterium]
MSRPGHGGGVDRAADELGVARERIVDFSASINPFGPPDTVRQALLDALERVADYPEIDAQSLRRALARWQNLPEENLLPGSGSTELIYLLPRVLRPRRALIIEPAFSEYAPALQQAGCRIDRLTLQAATDFRFEPRQVLEALHADTELVLLANPGNPTGVAVDPLQLRKLAAALGRCRLLIDEAFVDFSVEHSLLAAVTEYPNLFVLRSLTKFYAIPGLRVGYLAGPSRELARLAAERQPWTLSNLAIAAAKACLDDSRYRQRTLEAIPRLREQLVQGLERLSVKVFPSHANYLLLRVPRDWPGAATLCARLREQGLLLRNCADFASLDDRYLRVAVRGAEENRRLLAALAEAAARRGHSDV